MKKKKVFCNECVHYRFKISTLTNVCKIMHEELSLTKNAKFDCKDFEQKKYK